MRCVLAEGNGLLRSHHLGQGLEYLQGGLPADHADLLKEGHVAHGQPHKKPVHLSFGQGKGAVGLYGILSGHDHKRLCHGKRGAIHGDLVLLHALQKRRLRPGGGAVDFIGQDHAGKQGAGTERKFTGFLVVEMDAGEI